MVVQLFQRDEKGIALVAVLLALLVLSLVLASVVKQSVAFKRMDSLTLEKLDQKARLESAVSRSFNRLFPLGGRILNQKIDSGLVYDLGDSGVQSYSVAPETGKADLNSTSDNDWRILLNNLNVSEDKATEFIGRLRDWRDQDDFLNIGGAEKKEYRLAGASESIRNRPFLHVTELRQVIGVDEGLYNCLKPHITVYSGVTSIQWGHHEADTSSSETELSGTSEFNILTGNSYSVDIIEEEGVALEVVFKATGRPDKPFDILDWRTNSKEKGTIEPCG